MRLTLVLAAALASATPAAAAPADDFAKLLEDHYAWLLRESPTYATTLGVRDYDDRIGDLSLAAQDRRAAEAKAFLARLDAIPADGLTDPDRTNHAILKRMLSETVEGNTYPQRVMLFTTYYGWHQGFASLAEDLPFRTRADYESYLARLNLYPRQNDAALAVTEEAVKGGYTLPCSVLGNYERGISGVIAEDPTKSRFYAPFLAPKPTAISDADWAALQARGRKAIAEVINPAYAKHLAFYRTRYLPYCAKADSVSAQKGGAAYYAFRVRAETTTDLTPDQIHDIGLKESARIRAEMEAVAKAAGFASREAFIQDLRTNPVYYAKTPEELLEKAAAEAKRIDGKMPGLFGRLPRLPYGVKPIPAEIAEGTTTAYYGQGSPASGLSGTFYVNTSKLDQRPFWELPALTAHESVPGHHNQIALQQEMELAPFRQNFTQFTAFTEGWGLYSESLGEMMGIYDTPAKKMGQLSYQAWRAARLVVDTGIHAKGWDKARAVAFMKENTALTDANIDAEVNRYISWPGQALGYKIGELKIKELRDKAERILGAQFDIRRFHDAVLANGSVPLSVLEAEIDRWIATYSGPAL
ncbi:DUF885 domain-containing protein [Allosphingosinicella flava]|uniref:DUF885 domain-containing protein n=1 Tax=Allosphingosinicella flava TaxID=2771430 RepID=A0A7T2LLQ1_9SPHN|nr:DUF885 domain-containing protein [Sphingosinicella flava]QPQ54262.1 DUF885 domain-containing protein [Sphingosinicella flava]